MSARRVVVPIVLLWWVVVAAPPAGPVMAQSAELEPLSFSEDLRADVPVGGAVTGGLLASVTDDAVNPTGLLVWWPPPGAGARLCVEVESQDGRYLARLEYDAPDRSQAVRLRIPTAHAAELRRYSHVQMRALAYAAPTCFAGEAGTIVPATWSAGADAPGGLLLLLNSSGADVRVYSPVTGAYYRCERTGGPARVSYDTQCHLDLPSGLGPTPLTVIRNRFDTRLEDVVIEVYVP